MGFLDTLGGMVNDKMDQMAKTYEQKLRTASDSTVRSKWEEVCNNDEIDYRLKQVTEDEMRRRGLL